MIENLRDSINNGKISKSVKESVITYSVEPVDKFLVPHPRLKNVLVIKNTLITKSAFDVEVLNSFIQWQLLINDMYSSYTSFKFLKVKNNGDIKIKFKDNLLSPTEINNNTISLNLGLEWATSLYPKGTLVLNNLIFSIGKVLGFSESLKFSPMSPKFLSLDYSKALGLKVHEGGEITEPILTQYPAIRNNVLNVYGTSTLDIPYVLGCTNELSENYNELATIDDDSCVKIENTIQATNARALYRSSTTTPEYYLASNSNYFTLDSTDFMSGQSNDILNSLNADSNLPLNFTNTENYLTSLVITDKGPSGSNDATGQIKYFIVAHNSDINIFNFHGQLVSSIATVAPTKGSESTGDLDIFQANFNISYCKGEEDELHYIYWNSKDGNTNLIKLNDTLGQLTESGQTVQFCDSDTLEYGNIELFKEYHFHNTLHFESAPIGLNADNTKLALVDENNPEAVRLGLAYSPKPTSRQTSSTVIATGGALGHVEKVDDLAVNLKTFIVPTIDGPIHASLDVSANFLKILKIDPNNSSTNIEYFAWLGDEVNHAQYSSDPNNVTAGEVTKNTNRDFHPLIPRNSNIVYLRPFTLSPTVGYLYYISHKGWQNGRFLINSGPAYTNDFSSLPVTIGNKLFKNTFYTEDKLSYFVTNLPTVVGASNNSATYSESYSFYYPDLNHVGDFHLAISYQHGFVLTKINNTNLLIINEEYGGLRLDVSGGNPSMADFNDGWTPICMQFSPDDNFLYTIIKNPNDAEDKKLAIYPIYAGASTSGCTETYGSRSLSDNCIVIDNPFAGDLLKITLQDDGDIYIWSSGSEYCKISSPDLYSSVLDFQEKAVNSLEEIVQIIYNFNYVPSKSFLHNAVKHSSSWDYSNLQGTASDIRIKYSEIFNSSLPGVSAGLPSLSLTDTEYNPLIASKGVTYNILDNSFEFKTPENYNKLLFSAIQTDINNNELIKVKIHRSGFFNIFNISVLEESVYTYATNVDSIKRFLSSKNPAYIIPDLENNRYKVFYRSNTSTAADLRYKFINIERKYSFAAADYESEYEYSIDAQNFTAYSNGTAVESAGYTEMPGIEISKTSINYFSYSAYFKNPTNNNGPEIKILVHKHLSDDYDGALLIAPFTKNLGNIATSEFNDGDLLLDNGHSTITVSKDLKYIAISISFKNVTTDTKISTLAVYNLDGEISIGTQIGETIILTDREILVGSDNTVIQDQYVRSIEFSPNNSKLYVLIGCPVGQATRNSNRVMRLAIDRITNTFRYDGVLTEAPQINQPNNSRSLDLYSYTPELMSTQGDSVYYNNTYINDLYLKDDGNIFLSMGINPAINSLVASKNVGFVGGFITSPNSTLDSQLNSTSIVAKFPEDLLNDVNVDAITGSSKVGLISNNFNYEDKADSFDIVVGTNSGPVSIYGCMDEDALNYDASANVNLGCQFIEDSFTYETSADCNNNVSNLGDLSWVKQIPEVLDTLSSKLTNNIEKSCDEGISIPSIFPSNLTIEVDYAGSFNNALCGCQTTYKINVSVSVTVSGNAADTVALPWGAPAQSVCNGVHSASLTYIYIPIVDSNNEVLDNYPGNVSLGIASYIPYIGVNGPSNFVLESEFTQGYCINCISPEAELYDSLNYGQDAVTLCTDPSLIGDGSQETYFPFCTGYTDSIACGGNYGCTDVDACNTNENATIDDGSCIYPPSGVSSSGVDIDSVCGCNNEFINTSAQLDYCGSCEDPNNLFLKTDTPGCDCEGNLKVYIDPAGSAAQYYKNCAGDLPSQTEESNGCYYNSSGVLQEPLVGVTNYNGNCDCQGTVPAGVNCDCNGDLVNPYMCDCNTAPQTWYKKETDSELVSCINAESIIKCDVTPSFKLAHPDATVSSTVGYHVAYDLTNNIPLTYAALHTYSQGPLNLASCETCAEAGPNGEEQEYNCNGECKWKVSSIVGGSSVFEITLNLGFGFYLENACGQCTQIANQLPEWYDECCNTDDEGNQIVDACGTCINQIGPNAVKVIANTDGGYTVTHSGGTVDTDCSPCQNDGGPLLLGIDYGWDSLNTALESTQQDECNSCDTDWALVTSGVFLGYLGSNNQNKYKCNCNSVATTSPTGCCAGFIYDPCAYNGAGGCVLHTQGLIATDCNGTCPDADGNFLHGANECSECALLSDGDGLNDVGCCGSEQRGCDDSCYPAGTAPQELACGCDDATSCLGCTDPDAANFDSSATEDDGSCEYDEPVISIYNLVNNVVITEGISEPYLEEAFFIGQSPENLQNILENKNTIVEYDNVFGENIEKDNKYYTLRCQVISNNNTVLELNNPARNAEISYQVSSNNIAFSDITILGNENSFVPQSSGVEQSISYYFRLAEGLELTTYNPLLLFASIANKISVIKDTSGNTITPEFGFNNVGDFNPGLNTSINPIVDINNSAITENVNSVYLLIPKIDTETGLYYNLTLDFAEFIPAAAVEGCTNIDAENYNPLADVDNGSCTYAPVTDFLTLTIKGTNINPEKLKWVLFDANNNIIKYNFGNYPEAFQSGGTFVQNLETSTKCMYFMPIGFSYEDVWQQVDLSITRVNSTIKLLSYGSDLGKAATKFTSPLGYGGTAISIGNSIEAFNCSLGCGNTSPFEIKTDYCISNVKKDVKEFTDINFTIEANQYTSLVKVIIYDLDTGNALYDNVGSEFDPGVQYVNSFSIDKQTRIGIRINNPDNVTLKYSLVSEYGEIILKKTIN